MSNPDYDRDMREELAGDGPPLPPPAPDDEETALARARREVVSSQLVARSIRDPRVLAAIERIPRQCAVHPTIAPFGSFLLYCLFPPLIMSLQSSKQIFT